MNQQSQIDQLQETVAMLMQAMNALQSTPPTRKSLCVLS